MSKHIWKRFRLGVGYEYAETDTLEPPPGGNWKLDSKFGLSVQGGNSPSRAS